jgi:cell division protein FtsB
MKKGNMFRLGSLFMIALIIYFAYIAVNQQGMINAKNKELEEVREKIAEEMRVNEELQKEMESIDSDEYIEKVAREKLDMVKRGERVYVDIGN